MSYKPKHCCQCGEKIDRADWKPWTSRRFCQLCETELGIHDWIPRILVGIAVLFGLYGIGSYFQKSEKPFNVAPQQMAAANRKIETMQPKTDAQVSTGGSVQSPTQTNNSNARTKTQTVLTAPDLKIKQPAQTVEAAEKVYFCGAPTRKGTMCSRRVKNGGRCWQHEGQAALLPQEKLIAAR